MENKSCEFCNNIFEFNPKRKRERDKRFCSTTCARKFNGSKNKGRKFSEDVKKRMSERMSGEKNTFFGKSHSKKTKETIKSNALNRASYNKKNIELTEYEKEVLDGMMLADASIGDSSSISARIKYGCKFEETLVDVKKELKSIIFGNQFSYTSNPHKKSGKCYTTWFINSEKNNTLLIERDRWYPEGKKIVPEDIKITTNSCYWWFIGDGYNQYGRVQLCTESFSENCIKILVDKLKENGYNSSRTTKNRISIDKKDSERFMKWICEERTVSEQYKYKWEDFERNGKKRQKK